MPQGDSGNVEEFFVEKNGEIASNYNNIGKAKPQGRLR